MYNKTPSFHHEDAVTKNSVNENSFKLFFRSNPEFRTYEDYMKFIKVQNNITQKNIRKNSNVNDNCIRLNAKTTLKKKKMKKLKKNIKKKNLGKAITSRCSSFGLKEISKNVKNIVRTLKKTTYKEISDIIINDVNDSLSDLKDEKNIRRRIYDSLNVMKAMRLFKKDRFEKFILWNGDKYEKFEPTVNSNFSFKKNPEINNDLINMSNDDIEEIFVYYYNSRKQKRN
jgi:hypothetical protein